MKIVTSSREETIEFAKQFGQSLPDNSILCFFGDLAAGKTTFIKGLVEGTFKGQKPLVNSPTFTFLNIYADQHRTLYHFDLYRLTNSEEFLSLGFDDFFYQNGICCIEWSERIAEILPEGATRLDFKVLGLEEREIRINRPVA